MKLMTAFMHKPKKSGWRIFFRRILLVLAPGAVPGMAWSQEISKPPAFRDPDRLLVKSDLNIIR